MILLFEFSNWQKIILEAVPNFIPEYILVTGILVLTFFAPFSKTRFFLPYLTIFFLFIEIFFIDGPDATYFQGGLAHTDFYEKISFIGLLGSVITLIFCHITFQRPFKSEYLIYVLTAQLGLQILALSQNWLLSFTAFELVSFAGYLLVLTFKEQKNASESAIKYFIYGAFSSGMMLYGVSLYYGIHGNLAIANDWKSTGIEYIALGFILTGIFFKLSIFPFHFWAPEVYHGASAPIGAWLSTVSKLAGITVFYAVFKNSMPIDFQNIFWVLSMITMLIGNMGVLRQNNIYRLMGYSSIAHSGFLLMTMAVTQNFAKATVLFYAFCSIPITFLTFYAAFYFVQITQNLTLTEWNGQGRNFPYIAFFLVTGLAGLIGLPPTVGFIAKLNLVLPVWNEYTQHQNIFALLTLIVFVFNTLLALAAYSRIVIFILLRNYYHTYNNSQQSSSIFAWLLSLSVISLGIYGFDKVLQFLM